MRSTKPLYQIDGRLANLRWFLLITAGIAIALQAQVTGSSLPGPRLAAVVVACVCNLLIVLSLAVDMSPRPVPLIALGIDTTLAIVLIASDPSLTSPLLFYAIFPIITSALRFGWLYNVVTAGAIMGAYVALKLIGREMTGEQLLQTLGTLLILGVAATVSGTASFSRWRASSSRRVR